MDACCCERHAHVLAACHALLVGVRDNTSESRPALEPSNAIKSDQVYEKQLTAADCWLTFFGKDGIFAKLHTGKFVGMGWFVFANACASTVNSVFLIRRVRTFEKGIRGFDQQFCDLAGWSSSVGRAAVL